MAHTLFLRRPAVTTITVRMMAMSAMVKYLKPAAMLHFGEVAKAVWVYLDLIRQSDIAQPVADQSRLAGLEAAARGLSVYCLRYYINATGPLDIVLTQDAHAALDQMNAYDVRLAPSFDVENTVLRIVKGTKVV